MRTDRWAEIVGALLLIGIGLIFLLDSLIPVPTMGAIHWSALFLGGGVLFLAAFFLQRPHWWALIAGCSLIGLGLAILFGAVLRLPDELAGVALFASIAAGFGGVYLLQRRDNWWALIPAGANLVLALVVLMGAVGGALGGAVLFLGLGLIFVALYFVEIDGRRHNWWSLIPAGALFSLGVVVILSAYGQGVAAGATLFLGLGLTFGALYLMRGPDRPLAWAWIPAVALLALGGFVLLVAGNDLVGRLFLPVLFVVVGVVLLCLNWRDHQERTR